MDSLIENLVPGSLFNELSGDLKFGKIVPANHYEFGKYLKPGLNETQICSGRPNSYSTVYGGFKFYTIDKLFECTEYVTSMDYYCEVTIPDNAEVYVKNLNEFTTSKIILSESKLTMKLEIWDDLDYCRELVKKNGLLLQYVKNPCLLTIQNALVSKPESIKFVADQTEELCLFAISKSLNFPFQHIRNPTENICVAAVKKSPYIFYNYLKPDQKTYQVYLAMANANTNIIGNMPKEFMTEELICAYMAKDPQILRHVPLDKLTEKMVLFGLEKRAIVPERIPKNLLTNPTIVSEMIKFDPLIIRKVENQTEQMCLNAVLKNGRMLQYCQIKTDEICEAAFANDPWAIQYMTNVTDEHWTKAMKINPHIATIMKNPTDESCITWIHQNPSNVLKLKNPSENLVLAAVRRDGKILEHIENQTEEICSAAVMNHPAAIRFVKKQSENVCMIAVSMHGNLLQHIKPENQTLDICIAATNNDALSLQFAHFKTAEMCSKAVKKNYICIKYVPEDIMTEEMCMEIVSDRGDNLKHIPEKFQTEKVCLTAIKKYAFAIESIKNPTNEMFLQSCKMSPYTVKFYKGNDEEFIKQLLHVNIECIRHIKQTPEICDYAMNIDPVKVFSIVEKQSIDMVLKAISVDHKAMVHIRVGTFQTCLHACLINPKAIDFIRYPAIKKQVENCLVKLLS